MSIIEQMLARYRAQECKHALPEVVQEVVPTDLHRRQAALPGVPQVRPEVRPFLRDARRLDIWCTRYFHDLAGTVVCT